MTNASTRIAGWLAPTATNSACKASSRICNVVRPLLPVDHRPLLHRAKRVLQLLDYDGTQEVWLVPGVPVIE